MKKIVLLLFAISSMIIYAENAAATEGFILNSIKELKFLNLTPGALSGIEACAIEKMKERGMETNQIDRCWVKAPMGFTKKIKVNGKDSVLLIC